MKKLFIVSILILLISNCFGQIAIKNLVIINNVADSDRFIIWKIDSATDIPGMNHKVHTILGIDLKNYFGILGGPYMLFNHWSTVYNTSTTETILWNDSIPANQLTSFGSKIVGEYWGNDSANHSDTIKIYFQGTKIMTFTMATAQDWHYIVTIMLASSTSVNWAIQQCQNFGAGVSPSDIHGTITGLTPGNKLSLKINGRSASGSRQIQANMGTVYYKP